MQESDIKPRTPSVPTQSAASLEPHRASTSLQKAAGPGWVEGSVRLVFKSLSTCGRVGGKGKARGAWCGGGCCGRAPGQLSGLQFPQLRPINPQAQLMSHGKGWEPGERVGASTTRLTSLSLGPRQAGTTMQHREQLQRQFQPREAPVLSCGDQPDPCIRHSPGELSLGRTGGRRGGEGKNT
jgi:hypothetical protein